MLCPGQMFRLAALITCIAGLQTAQAALGDDIGSVQTDSLHMKASLRVSERPQYSIHEMTAPSGTVVKEYVSPSGRVFAVAWSGAFMPDLRQSLGQYFDTYRVAPRSRAIHRRLVQVEAADLVVRSAGRPKAFSGIAYVPSLVPAGVDASQLH